MDLKLKDEITKLLIEQPGMSISELAKRTKNYYSYTHKVVTEMEKQGLIKIEKTKKRKKKKEVTSCTLTLEYKKEWVGSLKRVVHSLLKDVEVKASFALMYAYVLITTLGGLAQPQMEKTFRGADLVAAPPQGVGPELAAAQTQLPALGFAHLVLIIIPILLLIWLLRKKKK